jgi:hypothetical protein
MEPSARLAWGRQGSQLYFSSEFQKEIPSWQWVKATAWPCDVFISLNNPYICVGLLVRLGRRAAVFLLPELTKVFIFFKFYTWIVEIFVKYSSVLSDRYVRGPSSLRDLTSRHWMHLILVSPEWACAIRISFGFHDGSSLSLLICSTVVKSSISPHCFVKFITSPCRTAR